MDYKFSLLDDQSDLIIGYCKNIIGLDGKTNMDGDSPEHTVSLIDFVFCNEFKKYIASSKESIHRLAYIGIVNHEKKVIGKYPFRIYDKIYYHKTGFPEGPVKLVLNADLPYGMTSEELDIWEKWRASNPIQINEWAVFDEDHRRAWLKVVSTYHVERRDDEESVQKLFFLDGTYVTDYCSFFCALGEAIRGPGGYYGFDFNSFIDCLHGGYGARAPFTLIWKNVQVAQKSLDLQAWVKEIGYKRRRDFELNEEPVFEELGNRPLFQAIVENLQEQGVAVVLE